MLGQVRRATVGAYTGTSSSLRAATTWTPSGTAWSVRAELGVTLLGDNQDSFLGPGGAGPPGGTPLSPTRPDASFSYALHAGGPVASGIVAGLTVAGGPFDETAPLITRRIRTDGVEGDMSVTLPGRLSMAGTLGWARVANGSVPNSRVQFTGQLHYALTRGSWVGAHGRITAYDTTAFPDGYFAPQRFGVAELVVHGELPRDIGWNVIGEAGLGVQSIRVSGAASSTKAAQRAQAGVVYRPVPGTEWGAMLWIANVASPFAQTTDYRAGGVTLRAKVVF
ncbi:MAG: hypothetical protein HY275_11940 [Gemmatimonadetes bacterium]|nr:hypothetical protein [Gemmatimonadota bacterium]